MTQAAQSPLSVGIGFCLFSGFESETTGPGTMFDRLIAGIKALPTVAAASEFLLKPYSVLPGNLAEFLALFDRHQFVIPIGHSFGGAAVKWLTDQFHNKGIKDRVPIAVLFDGVPNPDRFGQLFLASEWCDTHPENRWGIFTDVAANAVQIYQRVQLFPQGTQIREVTPTAPDTFPRHWNINAAVVGNPQDNHCDVPADEAIQDYVIDQVAAAIQEAIDRNKV